MFFWMKQNLVNSLLLRLNLYLNSVPIVRPCQNTIGGRYQEVASVKDEIGEQ